MVKPEEPTAIKQQIKEELPDWLGTHDRYNNLDVDLDDAWPI